MLRAAVESLLSLVYPHHCRVCSEIVDALGSSTFCEKCWSNARVFSGSEMLCSKCGAVLGAQASPTPVSCRRCDDLSFDQAISLGVYEGALAAAVIALKRSPFIDHTVRKAIADSSALRNVSFDVDLIVPVPLSRVRFNERGFNQAQVIANEVATVTGVPVDALSLARNRHTPMHRMGMDSKARHMASLKAFVVTREKLIQGKRILLVDDVLTSGATTSACAAALKKSGSGSVNVFTLARAVMR